MTEYEQGLAFGGVIDVFNESSSTRHLDDIASIVRVQGTRLEKEKLDVASALMGTFSVWRALWEGNR